MLRYSVIIIQPAFTSLQRGIRFARYSANWVTPN